MPEFIGNIRKMKTELADPVQYHLHLKNVLEDGDIVPMTGLVGKEIEIEWQNAIHCVVTGKKIKKAYGEGMCYEAFRDSPQAVESIIRPELSQAHLGIGLRDLEWEKKTDLQPHYVYISQTAGVKVGVTRETSTPSRWIDQGAVKVINLAVTPYRQAAGLIEVALKDHIADKTNWRKMLMNVYDESLDLIALRDSLSQYVPEDLKEYVSNDQEILEINFPVLSYPEKVKSMKLDKVPLIQKKLMGIKGQYLLFEDDTVMNVRSHSGYQIALRY